MEPESADQFLVQQIRQGEQSAWRQLIERYEGRLTAYARMRTASLSDAEDLVQETFIGFVQSLLHYDAKRALETYLFSILRYKICDELRRRKIVPLNPPADSEDWWDQILPSDCDTPSGIAVNAETRHAFEQDAHRLHRRKAAGPARHGSQHAVFGAGVAVFGIEGIAHETAVAGAFRQMPCKGPDLTLKAAYSG